MQTITKKDLVNYITEALAEKEAEASDEAVSEEAQAVRVKVTKLLVKEIIQSFLDKITQELIHGNRVEFREFGVFEVKHRDARLAQNPRTLETVHVPAKRVVRFRVGRRMRDLVNDGGGRAAAGTAPSPLAGPDRAEVGAGG